MGSSKRAESLGKLSAEEIERRLARLDEILELSPFEDFGEWCEAAQLSRSYIGTYKTRIRKGQPVSGNADAIGALAKAAGVTERFFLALDDDASPRVTQVPDRAHPVIARVGERLGYDDEEIVAASTSVFGLTGTSSMTEEQAAEILDETRRQRRNLSRVLAPKIAPAAVDDDAFDPRRPRIPAVNPRRIR